MRKQKRGVDQQQRVVIEIDGNEFSENHQAVGHLALSG
jgi:hypothetical protein